MCQMQGKGAKYTVNFQMVSHDSVEEFAYMAGNETLIALRTSEVVIERPQRSKALRPLARARVQAAAAARTEALDGGSALKKKDTKLIRKVRKGVKRERGRAYMRSGW